MSVKTMLRLNEFAFDIANDVRVRVGQLPVTRMHSYQEEVPQGVRMGLLSEGNMIGGLGDKRDRELNGPSLFLMANKNTDRGGFTLLPPFNISFVSLVMGLEGAESYGLNVDRLIDDHQAGFAFRGQPACSAAAALARQITVCPLRGPAKTLYISGKMLEGTVQIRGVRPLGLTVV